MHKFTVSEESTHSVLKTVGNLGKRNYEGTDQQKK